MHLAELRRGVHHSWPLQTVFRAQGELAMRLVVLEGSESWTAAELRIAERKWIAHYVEQLGRGCVLNDRLEPAEISMPPVSGDDRLMSFLTWSGLVSGCSGLGVTQLAKPVRGGWSRGRSVLDQ